VNHRHRGVAGIFLVFEALLKANGAVSMSPHGAGQAAERAGPQAVEARGIAMYARVELTAGEMPL